MKFMKYIGEKELTNKLDEFKNHLEHADRMILSARFGDGKSFLDVRRSYRV